MSAPTTQNPFSMTQQSNAPIVAKNQLNSLVDVESQRAIQEVQAAMVVAKQFPRDQIKAVDNILQACTRQTLAEGALYSYQRGGQEVTGPSIRLAEAIAQTWGNLQFGIREISQNYGESVVEAFAWDIETNTKQTKIFTVPHKRFTRKGTKLLEDPRDIYEIIANQGARRLRACILGVIPGDVVESAVNQCEVTLKTNIDISPESIKKMIEAFKQFGVDEEMIKQRIGKRIEAINSAQMLQLKKIFASLRDGMSGASDWFEHTAQKATASPLTANKSPLAETQDKENKAETMEEKAARMMNEEHTGIPGL